MPFHLLQPGNTKMLFASKKIRTFRNMTQAELGAALGWGDKGANRLAQYETNYRVPRKDLVTEMAKILDVNPLALYSQK